MDFNMKKLLLTQMMLFFTFPVFSYVCEDLTKSYNNYEAQPIEMRPVTNNPLAFRGNIYSRVTNTKVSIIVGPLIHEGKHVGTRLRLETPEIKRRDHPNAPVIIGVAESYELGMTQVSDNSILQIRANLSISESITVRCHRSQKN